MDNSTGYNDSFKEETPIWEKMYMRAEDWQQDLAFFKEEFGFLHNLIGGYIVWVGNEDDMPQIQTVVKRLNKLQDVQGDLNQVELLKCLNSTKKVLGKTQALFKKKIH